MAVLRRLLGRVLPVAITVTAAVIAAQAFYSWLPGGPGPAVHPPGVARLPQPAATPAATPAPVPAPAPVIAGPGVEHASLPPVAVSPPAPAGPAASPAAAPPAAEPATVAAAPALATTLALATAGRAVELRPERRSVAIISRTAGLRPADRTWAGASADLAAEDHPRGSTDPAPGRERRSGQSPAPTAIPAGGPGASAVPCLAPLTGPSGRARCPGRR